MGINGISINNYNGIDTQNVNKVSADIFARLETKSVDLNKVDLTQFNRATQGTDLYSNKVSLDVQRQISMMNAGLFAQTGETSALQTLKAQAASSLYSNTQVESAKTVEAMNASMNVFQTSKDKKGSNPFYAPKTHNENAEEATKEGIDFVA